MNENSRTREKGVKNSSIESNQGITGQDGSKYNKTGLKWSTWVQMGQNGSKHVKLDDNESNGSKHVKKRQSMWKQVKQGLKRAKMGKKGSTRVKRIKCVRLSAVA